LAILVILVLAILWGAVLLPPILRSREGSGRPTGVVDFFDRLREGLGRTRSSDPSLPPLQPIMGPIGSGAGSPAGPVRVPGGMTPQQRRRRDVLVGLLAASGLTFMMALFAGNMPFWVMHLLADMLLVGYVYLLLRFKARAGVGARTQRPANVPVHLAMPVSSMPNVHDLTARRFPPATVNVEAPREATVLALRRSASW
jgi:hypothetical protein